jgi:hypothetical protein
MAKYAACPTCETRLSLAEGQNGRRIKCPRCKQVLQVGDGQLWLAASPAVAPTAPPPPQYTSEEYMTGEPVVEEEAPEPRRRRRRRRSAGSRDYGLSGGEFALYGLLFFVVPLINAIVGMAMFFTWRESYPRKAGQIMGLGWGIFGTQAVIGLMVGGIIWGFSAFGAQEFTSTEGRFKVLMPGKPVREVKSRDGQTMITFTVTKRNGEYGVGYIDLPVNTEELGDKLDAFINLVRQGAISSNQATFTNTKSITLAGRYKGLEVEGEIREPKGVGRVRIYFVGSRMYIIAAVGKQGFAESSTATKFLDSFALIDEDRAPAKKSAGGRTGRAGLSGPRDWAPAIDR